jgi:hypothetical protein
MRSRRAGSEEVITASLIFSETAIGPIDPQIFLQKSGSLVSAQAVMDEYETAKKEVVSNPESAIFWAKRIEQYPVGFYHQCQTITEYSKKLVKEWLETRMLKDNKSAAEEISNYLGTAKIHKAHGNPICYSDPMISNLKITLLESDQVLQDKVLTIYHACDVLFNTSPTVKIVENHNGKGLTVTKA